jgi:hypothetical protein
MVRKNAPQYYVLRTLPVLFAFEIIQYNWKFRSFVWTSIRTLLQLTSVLSYLLKKGEKQVRNFVFYEQGSFVIYKRYIATERGSYDAFAFT